MTSSVLLDASLRIPPNTNEKTFASSIPVIDISKFENTATRSEFLVSLEKALKVGFFAVVNPEIDLKAIKEGYMAFDNFFASPLRDKMQINDPKRNGQRGFVPGETALGSSFADNKEFVRIGPNNNLWPTHMNLEEPALRLYRTLQELGHPILNAISLLLGKEERFLNDMTKDGDNLMCALHYYPNPKDMWAKEHTDIDLLTILPFASEKGLEVEIDNEWVPVYVPENALIVNVGDMLEAFSNGAWPSCKHRVKSTTPDTKRESIVFFIHPADNTVIKPLGKESPKYPEGTRLEYLFLRLFSLKTLTKELQELVIHGDFIKRIKILVDNGSASESVKHWFKGFQKTLELQNTN